MLKSEDQIQHDCMLKLSEESIYGSDFDNFIALVNLSKELQPLLQYDKLKIIQVWEKYRFNNEVQNYLRQEPFAFSGFKEKIGMENIISCFEKGGIFATFHFGHYRHVPLELTKSLNKGNNFSLDIAVDRESYDSELELTKWNEIKQENNISYIIAEENISGLKLLRLLKQGGSFLLYLDGNTGAGEDSKPIEVQHITSLIRLRSGIFRLLLLTKKPLCLVMADLNSDGEPRLKAENLRYFRKENFEQSVNEIYTIFRNTLINHPELWRFWYRHHLFVNSWIEINNSMTNSPSIDWRSNNGLGLDITTGNVYKLDY